MNHQPSQISSPNLFVLVVLISCFSAVSGLAGTAPELFPHYQSIKTNVVFWKNIYATHSVNTAVLHDQNHLSRIYSTISLQDKTIPGAQKQNSLRIKKIKKYYADLLLGLSKKKRPVSDEEKRIAALFGNKPTARAYREAAGNMRIQTGLKERFTEGVVRSGAYMRQIKQIFRDFGLPEDLSYLPHVESSFNPKAFSKFGASGMWQFTRSTGKNFMQIDYIIDERRDPLVSAKAAARLLKRNYKLLGSWPLALTAYNYGAAGMKRALNQEGSYEKIFRNYRKGHFKFASRNFYSEFLAAVHVAKIQERSGNLRFAKPLATVSIKIPAYADAVKLCAYLGISKNQLSRYNPSLRTPVFNGTKYIPENFVLKLPYQFKQSTLLASFPPHIFHTSQKRSKFYQVRSGDTAGGIATRHSVSLNSLIKANQLNRQAFIRVGQNLRIPSAVSEKPITRSVLTQSPIDIVLKDLKKVIPGYSPPQFEENSAVSGNLKVLKHHTQANLKTGTVEVQPDESVGLFADWLKLTPETIRLSNNISAGKDIHPGQKIVLDFINVSAEDFEIIRFDFHQEIQEDFFDSYTVIGMTTYKVSEGDTLWDICHKKFDLPLWLLKKYNDKLNYSQLDLSTNLQIPVLREIKS